jgi:hypothetical protein
MPESCVGPDHWRFEFMADTADADAASCALTETICGISVTCVNDLPSSGRNAVKINLS